MGKSKKIKSKLTKKQEKEKIKSILNKQKEIKIDQNITKNLVSSKNLNYNLETILNKKIKKTKIKEEQKANDFLDIKKVNLFEIKNYENENVKNFEVKKDNPNDDLNKNLIKEDLEYKVLNPFKKEISEEKLKNINEFIDIGQFDDHLLPYLNVSQNIIKDIEPFLPERKKFNFDIKEDIINFRKKLPIAKKELEIIDSINNNLVTIISGSTGSGKSTQIPQYLIERGIIGKIGVTQPRKLAAIGLAKRTSFELNQEFLNFVGYQVRFDSNFSNQDTKIKFMTDGILLREMMSNFLLNDYEYIIIDEAHERKVNTDLLLGLLSRIINIRANLSLLTKCKKFIPLKLIIMSATLKINDFTQNKKLFSQKINIIEIEEKKFDIKIFNSISTPDEVYEDIVNKVKKIHLKLPEGGILIFLTGKEEINYICDLLNEELKLVKRLKKEIIDEKENDGNELEKYFDLDNIKINEEDKDYLNDDNDFIVLPLYGKLSFEEQNKIYSKFENKRIIVVSTNIAETSLTIPNIKYLIDSGKEKIKYVDNKTGIIKYNIEWISKSSANQRAGRVGRTSNGYVYRIYTNAVYSKMKDFSDPEILTIPLEKVVLQLMSLGIKNVFEFPYPSVPSKYCFKEAFKNLLSLKAIDNKNDNYEINKWGKILSFIPLEPKLSKILLQGNKYRIIGYTFLLCGVFLVEDIFDSKPDLFEKKSIDKNSEIELTSKEIKKKNLQIKKYNINKLKEGKEIIKILYNDFINENSDFLTLINILGNLYKYIYNNNINEEESWIEFCKKYKLNIKNIKEIYKLINQISSIMSYIIKDYNLKLFLNDFFKNYKKPDLEQTKIIEEIIIYSKIDNLIQKLEIEEDNLKKTIYRTQLIENRVKIFPFTFTSKKMNFFIFNNLIKIKENFFCFMVHNVNDISLISKYDIYEHKKELILNPVGIYKSENDSIYGFYKTSYGKNAWEIPYFLEKLNYYENEKIYIKFFFYNFIKGKVIKWFKVLKEYYLFKLKHFNYEYLDNKLFQNWIKFFLENKINNKEKWINILDTNIFKELFLEIIKNKNKEKIEKFFKNLKINKI